MKLAYALIGAALVSACGGGDNQVNQQPDNNAINSPDQNIDLLSADSISRNNPVGTFDQIGASGDQRINEYLQAIQNNQTDTPDTGRIDLRGEYAMNVVNKLYHGNFDAIVDFDQSKYVGRLYGMESDLISTTEWDMDTVVSGDIAPDGTVDGNLEGEITQTIGNTVVNYRLEGTVIAGETIGQEQTFLLIGAEGTLQSNVLGQDFGEPNPFEMEAISSSTQ